ncbi:MAG: hypothetical protein AB7P40_03140 [Chloroflexota bacterium]
MSITWTAAMKHHEQEAHGGVTASAPAGHCYAMYGRRVYSEVRLPVPLVLDDGLAARDWAILRADPAQVPPSPGGPPMVEQRDPDGTPYDRFFRSGGEAWLVDRQAGTCHLEPHAGRITVYPVPGADEDDLGLLLLGPVSSFMLHQTGHPNLHASAVVTQDGACAFIGPSTLGKSTMAASLLLRGARLLTDDILPLRFRPDGVYGMPGAPMMKVWPATAQHTLDIAEELPRLTTYTDKRLLRLDEHQYVFENRETYLRAIYILQRYDPAQAGHTEVRIEVLTPRDAALALLSQTFRGSFLLTSELVELLARYQQLVRQARVAIVHLPHGLEYRDAVSARVLQDMVTT